MTCARSAEVEDVGTTAAGGFGEGITPRRVAASPGGGRESLANTRPVRTCMSHMHRELIVKNVVPEHRRGRGKVGERNTMERNVYLGRKGRARREEGGEKNLCVKSWSLSTHK